MQGHLRIYIRKRLTRKVLRVFAVMIFLTLGVSGCSFLSERAGFEGAEPTSSADALLAQAEFDQLNGKWPHEVVEGYMKSITGFSEVAASVFTVKGFDPGTRAQAYQVLKGQKITEFTIHKDTAKVEVQYEISARIDRTGYVRVVNETISQVFQLELSDGVWKITQGLKGRYVMEGRPGGDLVQREVFYFTTDETLQETTVLQVPSPVATGDIYYATLRILFYQDRSIPDELHSWVPLNSTLLGVGRHGDALLVNLLPDFDQRLPEDEDLRRALMQIVRTGVQFEGVKGVKFLVENEPYARLKKLGLDPARPVTFEMLSPAISDASATSDATATSDTAATSNTPATTNTPTTTGPK